MLDEVSLKENMELVYVAYIALMWYIFKLVAFIWRFSLHYIVPLFGYVHDLRKYGNWAVVTGCTDGIGLQYALQLAAKGFNIVLISRSEEKLEAVSKQITEKFNVKTKIIVYDFAKVDGYEYIAKELEDLDIGILVNNVGMAYGKPVRHDDSDLSKTFNIMTVNMFSCTGMSHAVITGMSKRKRGLMIHISSLASKFHVPFANVYFATKTFMNKYVKCFSYENEGIIDHQLVLPGYVESKMSKRKASFFFCPTAEDFVRSAIGTIGFADITCGYWSHELQKNFFQPLLNFPLERIVMKNIKKNRAAKLNTE